MLRLLPHPPIAAFIGYGITRGRKNANQFDTPRRFRAPRRIGRCRPFSSHRFPILATSNGVNSPMNIRGAYFYLRQLWRGRMDLKEFTEKLQQFVDQAKDAKIPLEDIISELEDLRDSLEEESEEDKDSEEEEEEEEK
jgi:hypothetical protein